MTSYIEGFVGDENPEDIEVAIVACCIYDILKSHIGQPITDSTDLDIYTKVREFAEEYWGICPIPPGYVVIKGVIEP